MCDRSPVIPGCCSAANARNPEQFHALRAVLPANAQHACGAGKTRKALHAAGIDAQPFPNGHEWQRWLQ